MKQGVFVGRHERTGTHLIMTPDGLSRGVGLHRLPASQRWDVEFLKTCKGVPWEVKPCRRETSQPMFDESEQAEMPEIPVLVSIPMKTRQLYVLHADIERYGPTETCTACAEIGMSGRNKTPHNEECRRRIAELMTRDEDSKVRARYQRHSEKTNQVEPEETAEGVSAPQDAENHSKYD